MVSAKFPFGCSHNSKFENSLSFLLKAKSSAVELSAFNDAAYSSKRFALPNISSEILLKAISSSKNGALYAHSDNLCPKTKESSAIHNTYLYKSKEAIIIPLLF